MILRILVLLLLLATWPGSSILSQQEGRISGRVIVDPGEPLGYGTVVLLKAADSAAVKTVITNDAGDFEFRAVPEGRYRLRVMAAGIVQQEAVLTVVGKQAALSAITIHVQRAVAQLQAVKIVAKRPLVEIKIDMTVVNVDALLSNAGSNALEVLESSPGVRVDNDNINLNGKQAVTIYIDDKPTYLQGSDLASYLRSIPAGMLDRIEIMPNPPARYDAAGNGGIINIKLKKNRNKGFNAAIVSENIRGRRTRLSQSANLGFRNDKFNLYGNLSYYAGAGLATVNSSRNYVADTGRSLQSLNQLTTINTPNHNIQAKAGIDWYASPKTTWSAYISRYSRGLKEETALTSTQSYFTTPADSITKGNNLTRNDAGNTGFHSGFRQVYDTLGRELSILADYTGYEFDQVLQNENMSYQKNGNDKDQEALNGILSDRINIFSVKGDYVHPITRQAKIEAGFKSSMVSTRNNALYEGRFSDTTYAANNHFKYKERIHAAYFNYSGQFKRIDIQTGLRLEHADVSGKETDGTISFDRSYTRLFPTMFLLWKVDRNDQHRLHFSFGRRIDRPGYANLNPFAVPRDRYTYTAGNPLLKPALSLNFELAYIFRSNFTASFFYNRLKDAMSETVVTKDNLFYSAPGNLSNSIIRGFSLNGLLHPLPWWQCNASLLYSHTSLRTLFNNQDILSRGGSWNIGLTQQLTMQRGWSAELVFDYSSAQVYAQVRQAATWFMHAGIGKKIWKEKGSVRLNVRDLFYTRVDRQDYLPAAGVAGFSSRKWDTRSITLAFTYRLSKGKSAGQKRLEATEENKRLAE